MGVASFKSPVSPPPFAAQFAEVTVDTETGQVLVDKLVMAVDSGIIVNPLTASGSDRRWYDPGTGLCGL